MTSAPPIGTAADAAVGLLLEIVQDLHAAQHAPDGVGLNTSNDRRSRFTGPLRRSRVGHLAPSRTVPTVVRLKPGISEQRPSGKASMWLNGKSAVSKARVCFPSTTQNGPTRQGHIM